LTETVAAMAGLRLRSVNCIPIELPLRSVPGTSAALDWDADAVERCCIA
jgi:hypothetical protein